MPRGFDAGNATSARVVIWTPNAQPHNAVQTKQVVPMPAVTFPSSNPTHRRADMGIHALGLGLIGVAGGYLILKGWGTLSPALLAAVVVYVLCALISNLASWAYHFLPWHGRRTLLRRIDHAAIYPSISGTFTPFFVQAGTTLTLTLLVVCWVLTALAIWSKITSEKVKSRWSTASYLGLGAIGLCALPDLNDVPIETLWCVLGGSLSYVIGVSFYVQKARAFRYAIWHGWVNIGGILMFVGIWLALYH